MRQIKFRGKNINTNEWVYGYYWKYHNKHFIMTTHQLLVGDAQEFTKNIEVIPETVEQYTGLNDHNGTEIYE